MVSFSGWSRSLLGVRKSKNSQGVWGRDVLAPLLQVLLPAIWLIGEALVFGKGGLIMNHLTSLQVRQHKCPHWPSPKARVRPLNPSLKFDPFLSLCL